MHLPIPIGYTYACTYMLRLAWYSNKQKGALLYLFNQLNYSVNLNQNYLFSTFYQE